MDSTLIYMAALVVLIAVAVGAVKVSVRRNGDGVGGVIKQLLLCVGIATLLPLTSWAGATILHPRTNLEDLMEQRSRAQQETYDTQDQAARAKSRDEQQSLNKQVKEQTRKFYGAMFWVGFPIGLIALVAGMYVRTVPVGTGLAVGGLCTLGTGCYSYWDDMGDYLRFFSLLIVLALLLAIGLTKFRAPVMAAARPAM